jgi:alpha,alpha-trehalose phosphorylase
VRPLDGETRIVVQSELVANEPGAAVSRDPRAAAALAHPLVAEQNEDHECRAVLVHRTRSSGIRMAAGMDHVIEGPSGTVIDVESHEDLARLTVATEIGDGEGLVLTKFIGYGWSSRRSLPAVRDQVDAALSSARRSGWDGLVEEQREYLDEFWDGADVEIDGDSELQQAIRFALFHTLQCGARTERRAIAAKGLTGSGYDGHAFWDSETFVLPVLSYVAPDAAADALRWRLSTLGLAHERAFQLGLEGAAFPWRTIRGHECSAYWPAGTAAFHVAADIADAVIRHVDVTGDLAFERETGLQLLVETARLWRSLGHHDVDGRFHIDGVTGPDEYTAIVDDNIYTNLMAQRNLRGAVEAAARHPRTAARLGVDDEEIAAWRDAAAAMAVPFDERLGVHQQSAGFTGHAEWDFENTTPEQYPLLLNFPYFDLYRKQVVKQPDLVLALYKRGDYFTDEQKARDFAYYERITVRDSSLSACVQAIVAAEVGQLDLAYDYFGEAALVDIDDLAHNTRDGLHIASLAGSWLSAVAGFGGLRDHGGELSFAPRIPHSLQRLAFRLTFQGRRLRVEIVHGEATYELRSGDPLTFKHDGEEVTLEAGESQTRSWSPPHPGPVPEQPPGRGPSRRRPGRAVVSS